MHFLRKVKTLVGLLKNLREIPTIPSRLSQHERAVTGEQLSEEIQKLVNFIDFRFAENKSLKNLEHIALQSGAAIQRLLGYDDLALCVETVKSIAVDSLDHIHPWGTKQDNSKNLVFNLRLCEWIGLERLRILDIGCSGGGFVKSIHDAGVLAVGIEGSDYSKIRARAEWGMIPHRLFTADATAPFTIYDARKGSPGNPIKFSVITAWEFIEHIEEADLVGVFDNIERHLERNGVVIMSVSPNDDFVHGVNLHRTVKPFDWWLKTVNAFGFKHHQSVVAYFAPDKWVRYEENAPDSFHLVLTRETDSLPPFSMDYSQ